MAKTKLAKNQKMKQSQSIEQLQARYREFAKQKIVVETDRKHAVEKLETLKKTAREKYGSDDLEQLQKTLESMKADNEKKRSEYQRELDKIETELAEIEDQFESENEEEINQE